MKNLVILRPAVSEYADYFARYISLVEGDDLVSTLKYQNVETYDLVKSIPEKKGTHQYAEGKWSIKELIGHLIDTERIMAYRALRFSRNDLAELEGFEQDAYIENSNFDSCALGDLAEEFRLIRKANMLMFRNLSEEAWDRKGIASGHPISVRALAHIIAGHELHHIKILKERYLS